MNWTPPKIAGAGCVGLFGLVVIGLLVAVVSWQGGLDEIRAEYERRSKLWREDRQITDPYRAELLARGGLAQLQAELQRGDAAPKSPLVLAEPNDSFFSVRYAEVEFERAAGGTWNVTSMGYVVADDYGRPLDDPLREVYGMCLVRAQVRVEDGRAKVLQLDVEDRTPQ